MIVDQLGLDRLALIGTHEFIEIAQQHVDRLLDGLLLAFGVLIRAGPL